MCLVARHLEAAGIATVILGSAIDIVEHCGAPRFLFTDFPLGNPCGRPYDAAMQRSIAEAGIDLLESAPGPGTIAHTPYRWSDNENWRERYMEVRPERRDELAAKGEARRAQRMQIQQVSRKLETF